MVFQQKSFLWFHSQLIFYLLRYNHKTLSYVQWKIAESFVPPSIEAHNPYISLYVRQTEYRIGRGIRKLPSLKQYFDLFYKDSIKGNIKTIYLNSEDENIFKEFKELNQNKSNYYKLLNITMKKFLPVSRTSSTSEETNYRILLDLLTDLYIQVHADLHAGTLTSNYCCLVDALKLVLGKIIPFYTPDNRYLTRQ
jgi:hypothetical protein